MDQIAELPLNFKSLPLHSHQISQKLLLPYQLVTSLFTESPHHIQPLIQVNII